MRGGGVEEYKVVGIRGCKFVSDFSEYYCHVLGQTLTGRRHLNSKLLLECKPTDSIRTYILL